MSPAANNRPVLVTGGRGYVGHRVASRLIEAGRPVVTYDRDLWDGLPGGVAAHGELHDVARLVRVCRDQAIGAVIHTAAISHPDVSVAMPEATFFANAMGTVQVFEAARLAGIERIVNFSSSSVYGTQGGRIDESAPLRPATPYGVSKAAGDMLGGVYRSLFGTEVVSLRIFWVYGPGQRMQEHVHDLIRAALDGNPASLATGGDHRLPMLYIDDAADAAIAAVDAPPPPLAAYNIVGPDCLSIRDVAARIEGLVPGARLEVGRGPLPVDQLGDMRVDGVAGDAAARDLGFVPQWDVDRGLAAYVNWLREHPF